MGAEKESKAVYEGLAKKLTDRSTWQIRSLDSERTSKATNEAHGWQLVAE
jgi:hypothetical protein